MTMPAEGTESGLNNGGTNGLNPEWNEALSAIPSEYHEKLIPHFQKWDNGVNEKLQSATSTYEPYKEFADNNIDPEHLKASLNLAYALETDPEAVYKALAAEFGNNESPNEGPPKETSTEDIDWDSLPPQAVEMLQKYPQLTEQVNTMQEILMHQHEERQAKEEDAQLETMYKSMADSNPLFAELNKDGKFEPFVNGLIMSDYGEKEILEAFEELIDHVRSYDRKPKAPVLLGSGGFMPEKAIRPRDMTEQQAKETALQMLKHMQGQQ
jgi:hypothetical protein